MSTTMLLVVGGAAAVPTIDDSLAGWGERFARDVDHRLDVPLIDQERYVLLLQRALTEAGLTDAAAQAFVLVDRSPQVQAVMVLVRNQAGGWYWLGATPVQGTATAPHPDPLSLSTSGSP